MPRVKKAFDREEMYRKIMPSATPSEREEVVDAFGENAQKEIEEINKSRILNDAKMIFSNKEIKWMSNDNNAPVVYNLTERMVIDRLDIALQKIECCRCDRCKNDILSLTMNLLPPRYSVCTKTEFEKTISNDDEHGLETTSAILKAILRVRKNPHH